METTLRLIRAIARLALPCLALQSSSVLIAARDEPIALTSVGAVGDNRADDTQALQSAFGAAGGRCLDGEGRTYRVRGSLRVSSDFCLVNARLRQDMEWFDVRPWIKGACPVEKNPALLADCGDPAMSGDLPAGFEAYLTTRTLLIRPEPGEAPIKVELRNVTVDRGTDPSSGSRSDAAGIWIGNAAPVTLDDVEVTGAGKGFGVIIVDSSNVTARRLRLHDMVWAPYAGDAPLSVENVRKIGWNTVPVREFRRKGDQGARQSGFYGTRVQEQLSCLLIVRTKRVRLEDLVIDGCRARFAEGDLPWQADGVGIGESSSDIRIDGGRIKDTWEGIDIVGGSRGVENVVVTDTAIDNSFGYAFKVGYKTNAITFVDSEISRAGLAGIVFYGPINNALVRQVTIDDVGSVAFTGAAHRPWQQERAGVLIAGGSQSELANAYPAGVVLDGVVVNGLGDCRYGVLNYRPEALRLTGFSVQGCETGSAHTPR